MKLETLLKQLEFEEEIEQAILHQFSKDKKKIKEISASAYDIKEDTFLLCRAKPLTRLITVIYLFTFKYDEYQALKIPDQIIINTLKDITLRSSLYLKTTGKIGITKESFTKQNASNQCSCSIWCKYQCRISQPILTRSNRLF